MIEVLKWFQMGEECVSKNPTYFSFMILILFIANAAQDINGWTSKKQKTELPLLDSFSDA